MGRDLGYLTIFFKDGSHVRCNVIRSISLNEKGEILGLWYNGTPFFWFNVQRYSITETRPE